MSFVRFALLSFAALVAPASAPAATAGYQLRVLADGRVEIARDRAQAIYAPVFTIVASEEDPALRLSQVASDPRDLKLQDSPESYQIAQWRLPGVSPERFTDNLFAAGRVTTVRATRATRRSDGSVLWQFADSPEFSLEAAAVPSPGGEAPVISYRFTAKKPGWFSVGYTGGPATAPRRADSFLQPLVWQEKRFPRAPLLTIEASGGLPLTLVSRRGVTGGLAVDPDESPFRLPTLANSRFGVMLRSPEGLAQPATFAPVLGQAGSRFAAGQTFTFKVRPVLVQGDWYKAYEEVARGLYGFNDVRTNTDRSLNRTIETMTDFAMSDAYSGWNADLKGFDYKTDVAGTVKVVSALHPLSLALIQDDPEIYRRRALPVTEYLMSRTKYLYNAIPGVDGQNAARDMAGPAAEVSELAELYHLSRGASPVFQHYAKALADKPRALNLLMVSRGDTFWAKLALYRLSGDAAQLRQARALADAYIKRRIDTPQTDFADASLSTGGQFWSDFAPRWVELFELWEATGEPRYLRAAHEGARLYASYAWLFPKIPDRLVTVDANGAPVSWVDSVTKNPMPTPRRTLPAWRVSQVGLTPEASNTHEVNPAIFLAPHAAYFLRIASATGDRFLHDIARSAIVGRYANYPGYDINGAFSDVYARADYPMRPYEQFSYNQVYYNHVWPHLALLTDFLLSDIEARSSGAIAFPSRYAQGYAYLRSKIYGDRPGRFMGDKNVRLWMPRGLVTIDNPQINYVSGYSGQRFYLALTNESAEAVTANLVLDGERLPFVPGRDYRARLWREGRAAGEVLVRDGELTLPVAAKGLTAISIDDAPVFTRLHGDYFDRPAPTVGPASYRRDSTPAGNVTAMLLSLGAAARDLYVWTSASDDQTAAVRLILKSGDRETVLDDSRHPFEFSAPASGADATASSAFDYNVVFLQKDGRRIESGWKRVAP